MRRAMLTATLMLGALAVVPAPPTPDGLPLAEQAAAGKRPRLESLRPVKWAHSPLLMPPADTPRLPRPARTSVRLERWGRGWRGSEAPGLPKQNLRTVAIDPEPGGTHGIISYSVPGGRYNTRAIEQELYLADLATGAIRLAMAPGVVYGPRWAPGGRWLAFGVGDSISPAALWVVDARTGRATRLAKNGGYEYRWLGPGLLLHYHVTPRDLHWVVADLAAGTRGQVAGRGERFEGLLGRRRSVVTRGRGRAVYVRPIKPNGPLTSPLLVERTVQGAVRVSPPGVFVNTVAVAVSGRRAVYAFTRSKGVPGGANTLYVETLGVYGADGRAWEVPLGFRGDLRDGDLHLSPDGRYLFIDYQNGTDEPAQGYHMYDLEGRRRLWHLPLHQRSLRVAGWEGDDAIIVHCTAEGEGCPLWRVTPDGFWLRWVPGVPRLIPAALSPMQMESGWAWQANGAWWVTRPGQGVRRLAIPPSSASGLPPAPGRFGTEAWPPDALPPSKPPRFDPAAPLAIVPAGQAEYLIPTERAVWPPR